MMKKLLALLLALLTLASFAACKKETDDTDDDLDLFRVDEVVYTSYIDEDTVHAGSNKKSVYHFELVDTETVAIVGYSGPTEKHDIKIPSVVFTGEDKDATAKAVVAIADEAFKNVSSIRNVEIPEGITSIGRYAFAYCAHLETVKFPSTLASIGDGAFLKSGLTELTFPESCSLTEIKGATFWKCNNLTEVTIPAYIKTVGVGAFFECQALEKVVLSVGVETVGRMAFVNCPKLNELHIPYTLAPASVKPLDDLCFLGSDALTVDGVTVTEPEKIPQNSNLIGYLENMEKYLNSSDGN